jgi:chromosome partitioning protein
MSGGYMIVLIGGIKGGTGKTTIATNLAVLNSHLGRRTLLVDADDQGSASDWADQRETLSTTRINFPTITLTGKNIHQQINKFKPDYDDIYIDTGGRDTINQRSALTCANCFLIPFRPRSYDVWTINKVKKIVLEIQVINPTLKVIVCITQGDAKGKDNEDSLQILSEVPDFQCVTTFIGNRKTFANTATQGLGVWEIDKNIKAKDEMLALHRAIHHSDIY